MKIKQVFVLLTGLALGFLAVSNVNAGSKVRIYGGDYHQNQHYYHKYRWHGEPSYKQYYRDKRSDHKRYNNYRNYNRYDRYNRYQRYDDDSYYYNRYRSNRCGSNTYRGNGYRNYYNYQRPHSDGRVHIYVR